MGPPGGIRVIFLSKDAIYPLILLLSTAICQFSYKFLISASSLKSSEAFKQL